MLVMMKSMLSRLLCSAIALAAILFSGQGVKGDELVALYRAGTVIPISGDTLSPGMILVKDGKIAALDSTIEANGIEVVDLGDDAVVIPGLVNAYSQLGLSSSTSDERTLEVTPGFKVHHSINWHARSMKQAIRNGITTACIAPGTENVIAGIAAIVKTDRSIIMQPDGALVVNLCSDPTRGNRSRQRPDSIYVRQPTNRMGVVWIIRHNFSQAGRDQDQETANQQLEPLRQVLAGDRQLLVVSRTFPDLETAFTLASEFGFKPVLVGGQESYRLIDRLAEEQAEVILTPVPTGLNNGIERTEICLNRAGLLKAAGVSFCLTGTDLLQEASFAVRHGLDRETALAAITLEPAKILGIADQVGSLEVGKDADWVVLTGDPLEFTTRIKQVIVGGRIVESSSYLDYASQ